MAPKFKKDFSEHQKELAFRIFNLTVGRVLKNAYENFNPQLQKDMDNVFAFGAESDAKKFIKKNIPGFNKLFKAESEKIKQELELEIKKLV